MMENFMTRPYFFLDFFAMAEKMVGFVIFWTNQQFCYKKRPPATVE